MSIMSELEKTAQYTAEAREEIIKRGGSLSSSAGLKDFPLAIRTMPADAVLSTVVENGVSLGCPVPSNASEYALLAEFGGMTYRNEDDKSLYNQLFEGISVYSGEEWEFLSSLSVPHEILALEGYGDGIKLEYYNKVDLINRKYIRCIDRFVLDGKDAISSNTANWSFGTVAGANTNYFRLKIGAYGTYVNDAIICDRYEYTNISSSTTGFGIDLLNSNNGSGSFIAIRPANIKDFTNTVQMLDFIKENPLVVKVARKVPIETDLLFEMNPVFKVEPNAQIENQPWDGDATPTKIIFQTRTQ